MFRAEKPLTAFIGLKCGAVKMTKTWTISESDWQQIEERNK
jgi:hypothetical protein